MGTNGRPLLLFGIHGLPDDLPIKERERVHPNRKFSDEVEQEIVACYLAGESTLVLGKAYGSPRKTIRGILIRHHIERRVTGAFPLRSHAKLYHSDPNELRRMVEGGMSIREIGRELKMSSSTVHNACARFGIPLRGQKEGAFEQRTQLSDTLFLAPLTANESWLLGLLLTDGCVSPQNRLVKLGVTDEDAVRFASQVIGFGSITRVAAGRVSEYHGQKIEGKLPIWNYVACSTTLVERLGRWGLVPRKTKTLAFPAVSAISLPDFLRGLWDGDGSWCIDKRDGALLAHFGSASEHFMQDLHVITSQKTVSAAKVRANKRGNLWQLQYYGRGAVALARWLYEEADSMCLARKRAIVEPFL